MKACSSPAHLFLPSPKTIKHPRIGHTAESHYTLLHRLAREGKTVQSKDKWEAANGQEKSVATAFKTQNIGDNNDGAI